MKPEDRLRQMRKERNLRQEVVARALGISLSTYVGYECGQIPQNKTTREDICAFYGISVDELYGDDVFRRCKWCGNPITGNRRSYCSDVCEKQSKREKRRQERAEAKRYCFVCGKQIPGGSSRSKYCSNRCQKIAHKQGRITIEEPERWDSRSGETYRDHQLRTYKIPGTNMTIEEAVRISPHRRNDA